MVSAACEAAGVSRRTPYDARGRDEKFAEEWDAIWERTTDEMEAEALRRATVGRLKPVFQHGRQVGEVAEYSDTLLMFLLKGRKPDVYRDNPRVVPGAGGQGSIDISISLDAGQRESLRAILRERPVRFDGESGRVLEEARRELRAGGEPDGE